MRAPSRLRNPNPHLGAYYGIVASAIVSLLVVLAMFEQLGWRQALIAQAMLLLPLVLYLLIAAATRTTEPQDFYMSGRRVPPVFNGFLLAATAVGGVGVLAYTGSVFFLGFDALAIGLGWTFGMLVAMILFVPYLRKAGAYTLPSFLSHRFRSRTLRIAGSALQIPPMALLLAAEIKIAALVAALFLPLSFSLAVLLLAALVAAVAIAGGMRSLTWTGSAEFIVGAVGLAVPMIVVSVLLTNVPLPQFTFGALFPALQEAEIGAGLTPVQPEAAETLQPGEAPKAVGKRLLQPFGSLGEVDFAMVFLCLALGTAALPSLLVRSGVAGSIGEQRRSSAWGLLLVALFAITAPSIAVFAKLLLFQDIAQAPGARLPAWLTELANLRLIQAADADGNGTIGASELLVARDGVVLTLPTIAELPYVLTALLAAGAMAIALAAAGSHLFTLAASLAEDCYRVLDRRPTALPRLPAVWAATAASALAAAVFLIIADLDPLKAALAAFALAGATFFPVLLLAIWWPYCTERGALAAMGTGFVVVLLQVVSGVFGAGEAGLALAALSGTILGFAGCVGTSLYGGAEASAAELVYFEDMRDPEGEPIYDRATQRAEAAAEAAAIRAEAEGPAKALGTR
jgi:cation/acetate symporter